MPRVNVYVDGLNLYNGALRDTATAGFSWASGAEAGQPPEPSNHLPLHSPAQNPSPPAGLGGAVKAQGHLDIQVHPVSEWRRSAAIGETTNLVTNGQFVAT